MVKYDDPFDLIERGNAFASSSSHWSAADAYFQASISLEHRAGTLSNPPSNEIEQRRIVTLFRTQSLEYFFKARHSLLRALTLENEQDRQNSKRAAIADGEEIMNPICSYIGNEESKRRGTLFKRLFMITVGEEFDRDINQSDDDVQWNHTDFNIPAAPSSLLPVISTLQTEATETSVQRNNTDIRLDEIRNGLERLGVSLPHEKSVSSLKRVSSEEQIKLIIQQASDVVHHDRKSPQNELQSDESDINENDSMLEGYEDQLNDEDNLDAPLMTLEKVVVTAGCKTEPDLTDTSNDKDNGLLMIQNAQALLLEAQLCIEMEHKDVYDTHIGTDQLASKNCNSPSNARRDQAKDKIESAVHCLQDAIKTWN